MKYLTYKVMMGLVGFLLLLALLISCGANGDEPPAAEEAAPVETELQVTSSAFDQGEAIPQKYTCDGEDVPPPLAWSGAPDGVSSYALIMDDPDAPGGTWVHWVLFDLEPQTTEIEEDTPTAPGVQGSNSWDRTGYGGPCPPGGRHRYYFKIYGLDTRLDLEAGATKGKVLEAMEGHVLAQGQLMGTYSR